LLRLLKLSLKLDAFSSNFPTKGLEARVGIEPTHKAFEVKLEPEQFKGVRVQKTAQRGRGGKAFQPYAGQERTVVLEKA
jgi:hypothetical protein